MRLHPTMTNEGLKYSALIVSNDLRLHADLQKMLGERGISTSFKTPEKALEECRQKPPSLAIIESGSSSSSAARIAAELLEISWTISTILVSDEDEEVLHEKTEGLGILGSIKSFDDSEALNNLLEAFFRVSP